MYKNIDFSKTGGFPLTQDVMAFLQSSYNLVFGTLAQTVGQYNILTGVTQSGGIYSNGWVSYNGEIVPFVGGASQSNVVIVESAITVTYKDSTMNAVIKTRKAVLAASGGVPLASFKRISLASVKADADAAQTTANSAASAASAAQTTANNALSMSSGSGIPAGGIIMWSGAEVNIPAGFKICNGLNSTPDLRDRFVVGAGAGSSYSPGAIGGEAQHILTTTEIPAHRHHITGSIRGNLDGGGSIPAAGYTGYEEAGYTDVDGGSGGPHENRPPYYALCFIMKS